MRVDGYRLPQTAQRGGEAFLGVLVLERLRPKQEIVSVEIGRGLVLQPLDLGELQLRLDRADHALGHAILQIKDIARVTLETLCPKMAPPTTHRRAGP